MKLLNNKLNIELSPATIVHVDTQCGHGLLTDQHFFPLLSRTPQTNVVFQLKDSNKILPFDVQNIKLPLYNMQEVDIISANQFVIGYVDVKSEEYYYITDDFYKAAGIGFIDMLSWLAGILVVGFMLTFIKNDYAAILAFATLFIIWMVNVTIKTVLNRKIENNMDELLRTFSVF